MQHKLTSYASHLIASTYVFQLVVSIVTVTVEKSCVQSTQFLATLIHHTNEDIRIVLLSIRQVPLGMIVRVHLFAPPLQKSQEADSLAHSYSCVIARGQQHGI